MMMKELTGKTIWLVGASSGIGYALAKKMAENDNFVIVTARNKDALNDMQAEYPEKISVLSGDITNQESLNDIEARLNQTTDSIDLVLLCAGTCEYDDGPQLDVDMYRRVFDVNFFASVACTRIALPMLKRARGVVVGVSSLASVVPFPRAEAYGASKAALEYFLQSLSVDLKETGVQVQVVRPGFVKTPLTQRNDFDMPYIMSAEEAAEAIVAGIVRQKKVFSFPWQLSWTLNFFSLFKGIWMKTIAGGFKKPRRL